MERNTLLFRLLQTFNKVNISYHSKVHKIRVKFLKHIKQISFLKFTFITSGRG